MSLADKAAIAFFALGMSFAALVWFNWVSTNDQHLLATADCMVKVQRSQRVSPQESFLICEREAR